jgi:small-conductance mechanosensitive channel
MTIANFFSGSAAESCLIKSRNKVFAVTAFAVFILFYCLNLLRAPLLLQEPDTLWQIRAGQWTLDHARVPTVDVYSYTAAGKPWVSMQWLSQVVYALTFNAGGWRAMAVLAAASSAAIVGIVCFYLLRQLRFSVAIWCAVLTGAAMAPHFTARPHVFSYVLLAIWMISLLDAYEEKYELPPLLTLAPLMILWANIHGSFTYGLTLLYIFSACCLYHHFVQRDYATCRRVVMVTVATTACAAITPYGILPAFMTTTLVNMKFASGYINELHSPDFHASNFILIYFVAIFLAIAGLGIRLGAARLISFGLAAATGLRYMRALFMFFLLAPIILARPAARALPYLAPQSSRAEGSEGQGTPDALLRLLQKYATAVLVGCVALAVLATASIWRRDDIAPPATIAPAAAIDFVKRNNITGNVFNSQLFGGYLIWSGIPVFIDGRLEVYGDAFERKYAHTLELTNVSEAYAVLDEYKVAWAILNPYEPLSSELARNATWEKAYADADAVVFVRHR